MIERTTFLYEVLLRFGPGGLAGAHVIDMQRIADNESGEIIADNPLPARPITQDEMAVILGDQVPALIEQVDQLTAAAGDLRAQLASATAEADGLREDLDTATARAAAAEAEIATLRARLNTVATVAAG